MKTRTIFPGLMLLSLICVFGIPAWAQTSNADFQQVVAAYQQSPSDAAAEKVIRLAAAMEQLPPIPEEARRHFVRGTALFKDAKSPDDYKQVVDEFTQAVRIAPWWPDARYNRALAWEASGDYADAIAALKRYLLFKLSDSDARAAQDKIYALEAKQEKAAKAKQEEYSPQAIAARQQNEYAAWLRKIDGTRYVGHTWLDAGRSMEWDEELVIRGTTLVLRMRVTRVAPRVILDYPIGVWGTPAEITMVGHEAKWYIEGTSQVQTIFTISGDGNSITQQDLGSGLSFTLYRQ